MRRLITAAVLTSGLAFGGVSVMAQSHGDKAFLEKSSQGNVTEVELSKLALRKTSNPDIRAFADKMIHDHTMLGDKMAPFLAQAGLKPSISLDTLHQHLYNKLKGLSGTAFDKEFVLAMDKDHHEDLKDFQKEVSATQDAALKSTVSEGEQVIAQHTEMIDGLSRKLGVTPAGA